MGFVKIDRAILEHVIWQKKPFSYGQAWIDLVLLANYEDKKMIYKGETIVCKRGDVNLSFTYLADRWGWSRDKVRTFLSTLKSDSMITYKSTTHRTTITLVNYGKFQDKVTTKSTTNRQQNPQQLGQQAATTKNNKEYKENKEEKILPAASSSGCADDDEGWMTGEELMRMWEEQQKHE